MAIIPTLFNRNSFRIFISFLALAFVASEVHVANAKPCVAFDSDFNLYAFGFDGEDFQLGTQDKWSSTVNPTNITTSGRPPFDGPNTTCYLAQFFDSIYVLNGDNSDPAALSIFNAKDQTWSTQAVGDGGPDPETLVAILDHDTNVFYALASGTMSSLDLGTQTKATSSQISWKLVGTPGFNTTGYQPTMALAENHIHFIGVPGAPPGNMYLYVIHFSFFQPNSQAYPAQSGGTTFPSIHGQTASIPNISDVQHEFAFIPDDGSATYIINMDSNTTLSLTGPSEKSSSTYTASPGAIVQLTSTGSISFIAYSTGNNAADIAATWNKINVVDLPAVSSGNSSTNSTANGSTLSGTPTASGAGATGTTSSRNGGLSMKIRSGVATFVGVVMTTALALL